MKYLVHLRPPLDLAQRIKAYQKGIGYQVQRFPSAGLHCTLMHGCFDENHEQEIEHTLDAVCRGSFPVTTDKICMFPNGALVLRLVRSKELKELHYAIADRLKGHINWDETPPCGRKGRMSDAYREYGSPFFGAFYNPHITLARVKPRKFKTQNRYRLAGHEWRATAFELSKKEDKAWTCLREYPLR